MKRTESQESVSLMEEHSISLESLMAKLGISEDKHLPLSSGCSIYRVPPKLRKENEEAYTPTLISIGPFHGKVQRLQSMHELKLFYLQKFLRRTQNNLLHDYVEALRDQEVKIRHCYSETSHMESDEFVNMIIIDSCFIIEFFLSLTGPSEEDPLVKNPWPTEYIKLDLLLLENQLPFFVLEDIFNLAHPIGFKKINSFVELAFKFFKNNFLGDTVPSKSHLSFSNFEQHCLNRPTRAGRRLQVYHLNDMLRMFYLLGQLPGREFDKSVKPICSTSQLREAGIKFKASKQKNISIMKVEFSNGVLTIPCFPIHDRTETMIRNVIAFEQCHHPFSSCVTDYMILWDHLVNTEKDVEMLVQKGIIQNFLSDNNAVASMINRLCRNVVSTSYNREYIIVFKKLNEFYNNPCHKYKANFRHDYLSSPWKIASFVAAILLLFLTLIQTICSVISLFQ
ncbi:UPF0481 protein At3g47200-like [Prosopis cineraria]|uniref:UPF0481 protein At3g47200-like n=1 Tax=Prosopis cineraria TaxID=364024 RepID=UPI00240F9023|nr:UPF0481 protein At3g47200-like [Prosopis cineraria]